MFASATSSSIVGALLIHSDKRWQTRRQAWARRSTQYADADSDVGDTIGDFIEGGVPVDLVQRRRKQRLLVGWVAGHDRHAGHDPDAHGLTTAGVDVTRVLDCHLRVDRVHASDMLMMHSVAAPKKNFPERPVAALAGHAAELFRLAACA